MKAKFLALALMGAAILPAYAAGDAVQGETVFKKCMACHAVGEGARNRLGPQLNAVIGRTAGNVDGFNYSNAMIEAGAGGLVWDETSLGDYLVAPKAFVPGTKMNFAGLKKPQEVEDVIAYLATFSE